MSLNDGDIKRIDARISAATALLQDKIAAEIVRLKPRGWEKALHLLREWSVLGAAATIIVALLALALTQWNAANDRMAAEVSFRTHTEDRLAAIEASLLTLRASQSPKKVLQEISSLPTQQFARALPALRKVSEQAASEVNPDASTLKIVAAKLTLVNDTAPDYWPTILQFIQFSSMGVSPGVPPSSLPTWETHHSSFYQVHLSHKAILLDGGSVRSSSFEECRIIFTENPVAFNAVQFINCVFEFPPTDMPTQYLKHVSQLLLGSDLQKVTITSL